MNGTKLVMTEKIKVVKPSKEVNTEGTLLLYHILSLETIVAVVWFGVD
jgi:hypothetical protein